MMVRETLSETPEATIDVDIIDDDCSARPKERPSAINFESNVSFAMQTVMDEEIDPSELGEEIRQSLSARAADIGPAIP